MRKGKADICSKRRNNGREAIIFTDNSAKLKNKTVGMHKKETMYEEIDEVSIRARYLHSLSEIKLVRRNLLLTNGLSSGNKEAGLVKKLSMHFMRLVTVQTAIFLSAKEDGIIRCLLAKAMGHTRSSCPITKGIRSMDTLQKEDKDCIKYNSE